MIRKKNVHNNLDELERLYNETRRRNLSIFYSKLAILELCGWIEEVMDDIVIEYKTRHIHDDKNIAWADDSIRSTFSFDYNKFKKMVVTLIGLKNMEKIEIKLNETGDLPQLKSVLGNLKRKRDTFAHTHIQPQRVGIIYSPSNIKGDFTRLYLCLKNFERELKKIK